MENYTDMHKRYTNLQDPSGNEVFGLGIEAKMLLNNEAFQKAVQYQKENLFNKFVDLSTNGEFDNLLPLAMEVRAITGLVGTLRRFESIGAERAKELNKEE